MGGKGASMNHFQSMPCSGMKTLKRCNTSGKADDIVMIDVDSDFFNNVIIIDVPESLKKKQRGSGGLRKEKNYPSRTVIFIDDDENIDNQQTDIGSEFNPGASSSMKAGPSSSNTRRPVNGQFQFSQENTSPVKLSKCKRTYSGKTSFNCFGLDSDSDSSDNDATDCEFMEDSSGKLREQWEKAQLKRKSDGCSAKSGMPDRAGASKSTTVSHQDDSPVSSCPNKESCPKDDRSRSGSTVNRSRNPSCDPLESSFADIDFNFSEKMEIRHKNADIPIRPESLRKGHSCSKAEQQNDKVFEEGGFCFFSDRQNDQAPSSSPSTIRSSRQDSCLQDDGTPQAGTTSNPGPSFCHGKASLSNDEELRTGGCSVENNVDLGVFIPRDRGKKSQHAHFNSNSPFSSEFKLERCGLKRTEKSDREGSLHEDTPYNGKLFNPRVPPSENREALFEEACSSKYPSPCTPGVSLESGKGDLICKGSPFCNIHLDETQVKQRNCLEGKEACMKLASNCHEDERNDLVHAHDGDAEIVVESCIFNEREKLKETDEYKRALEEEWSFRQRTLKIQAEEAQQLRRLRKRQRAENLRLLDMEKRQKQRVEEIRETQKKVEETMNLKELHRAEVRKDLHKLEITCHDMASLLRGLGIQVAGGLNPLPHEVRTAYKRALLSFHPDRASGSDMRHQVEAEEKFKLISRMKEFFCQFHDIGN